MNDTEHPKRRKYLLIALFALFIAIMGVVLPESDVAFETIENNTDLSIYGTGERLPGVTYYANDSEIQILLLGTATTDDDISMNLSVGGVVVQSEHLMDLPLSNPPRNISISMNIPKGSSYMVTNHSRTHVTWREYQVLSGKNGTLSINQSFINNDIAIEYVVNNTNLYNNGRITGVNYTANDSAIQLFLIFHVVGTGASLAVDTNLSINGTVVEDMDYRTTAGAGIHEHFSITAHIPKGAVYNVTNGTDIETLEWREYPILTGKNGTLSINVTGGTGSQNLSQVLNQGNQAIDQRINFTNTGKWIQIGYNNQTGLMEINGSSIFYYKQGSTYLGFTGLGFAYSAYNDRPMKFGESGTNYSQIAYNLTYGTTWRGIGTAANRLNITGFDKVNMDQDLNVSGRVNISMTNKSYNSFVMLGSTTSDPFMIFYENSTIRNEMSLGGSQIWRMRDTDSTKTEVGYITYATPGGNPGIAIFNSSLLNRIDIASTDAGFEFYVYPNASSVRPSAPALIINRSQRIIIPAMAGVGNAYQCYDSNGAEYRGNPGC